MALAYFLAARLSVGLLLEEGVAVFWPAAGVSSGVLIALGPRARWPVAAGVTAATVVIHQLIGDPLWAGIALGLSNAAEALIAAGLLERYFGADFNIVRLRQVFGLLLAAIVGTAISAIGGAVTYRLFQPIGNNADHLAALVRIRRDRNHHCCAAGDRARCRHTATAAPQRTHRRHGGTSGARGDDRNCDFAAAGGLGDCTAGRSALSNVVVGRRPLSTCLRRGSGVPGLD